jgi:hypothetical protein
MSLARGVTPTFELPEGFRFVPIDAAFAGQPLRVCVALRGDAESAPTGPWVVLRSTVDARVYLGAVVDGGGRVREWLELWVQTIANIGETLAANRDYFSNRVLDLRWRQVAKSFIAADPDGFLETGWEEKHPRPVFIDLAAGAPWHPVDPASGEAWTLAIDDAELASAGLPTFGGSLHRYWRRADGSGAVIFAPVTPGAPVTETTVALETLLPEGMRLVPFYAEAGLMVVKRRAPFSFDEYADFLGGRAWKGLKSARDSFLLHPAFKPLGDWDLVQQGGIHLFGATTGRAGRFLEAFHLKLSLLHQAVRAVRAAVQVRQLPFLNLSADSFRVTLDPPGSALPVLWTARLSPTLAGQAVALPIKTAEVRYFMALEQPSASVYRPAFLGTPIRGQGTVRIRRVFADAGDRTCLEGTLVTHERVGHSASDILWLRLPLADRVVDLFARLDTEEGLAGGEARFRTIPQDLDRAIDTALRGTEGSVFPDTGFETIPLLSSPSDLYSLGVLGTLLLAVNSGNTLGVAVDEMISFARKLGQEVREGESIADRAHRIATADSRWIASLGAQRLAHEAITADEAFAWLPAELWWSTLATVARFLPGLGPDSYCKDFGDASPFNLETVFDRPLADLDNLLLRSRGLLLSDWVANREMARVLQKVR